MGFYGRSAWQRQRDKRREIENAWKECHVSGHGGYNPVQKTLGGRYLVGPCPKCAALATKRQPEPAHDKPPEPLDRSNV